MLFRSFIELRVQRIYCMEINETAAKQNSMYLLISSYTSGHLCLYLSMEKEKHIGFADLAVTRRKIKVQFFNQINNLINWKRIDAIIGIVLNFYIIYN